MSFFVIMASLLDLLSQGFSCYLFVSYVELFMCFMLILLWHVFLVHQRICLCMCLAMNIETICMFCMPSYRGIK